MDLETQALKRASKELNLPTWASELIGRDEDKGINFNEGLDLLPKSEQWAAKAVARKFKNYLTYDLLQDKWYFWDGKIHRPCNGDALVIKIVKDYYYATAQAIKYLETAIDKWAPESDSKEESNKRKNMLAQIAKHKSYRNKLESTPGQKSLVESLKTEVDVSQDHYADDRRWWVIENGVYDIEDVRKNRRFVLLDHDPARPVYRMFNLVEEIGAPHDALDKFTHGSLEDAGQAKFLQKITAVSLMGIDIETRSVVTFQGKPQSGKSMWLKVIKHFARDFVAEPSSAAITKGGKNPYHARYPMRYARFNAFKEITNVIDREFLLMYSGMDEFTAEDKWIKSASYEPQGIMFFFSNHALNVDTSDPATFGRIKPLHFPHHFERCSPDGHELDPDLQKKIQDQGSGFLEWLKEGYLMALEEGLDCTDSMSKLKSEFSDEHPVFAAINDAVQAGHYVIDHQAPKSNFILTSILHAAYVEYCNQHAVPKSEQLGTKEYKSVLETRYPSVISAGKRTSGIRLLANKYIG